MNQTFQKLVIGASMAVGVSAIATTPAHAVTFSFNNLNEIKTYTGGSNGSFTTGNKTAAIKALTDKDPTSNVELWHSTENPTANVGFTATKGQYSATVTSVTASDWNSFGSQWLGDLLAKYQPFQSVWNGFSADSKSLVTSSFASLGMGDPNVGDFRFGQNGGVELKLIGHLDVKSKLSALISTKISQKWNEIKPSPQSPIPTLAEVNTLLSQAQTQLNAIPGQITTLQTQLNAIPGQITTLQTQLNAIPGQITTLQTQLNAIPGQIATLQTQLNAIPGQITALQTQLNLIPNTTANASARLAITNQITALNTARNTTIPNQIAALNTARNTTLPNQIAALNTARNTTLPNQIAALNTAKNTTLPNQIAQLNTAKNTTLPNQIAALTSFKDVLNLQAAVNNYEGEIGASEIAKVVVGDQTYFAYSFDSIASGITASDDGVSYSAIYNWSTPDYVASSTSVPEPSIVLGLMGVVGVFATKRQFKKVSG
ncbi:NF038130 family PEP-CTERM protein [Nostoc sp. TCL26-01]|uniref:NF038130 family PEP-CTERM protein n=1 Tax=Nostoc sp. TCL26-01 TaxID=2576904 RepID=UPI0015BA9DE7|nr:NF038130 family PEP-CTERM protein [Nostoc sp. TCL26-01]